MQLLRRLLADTAWGIATLACGAVVAWLMVLAYNAGYRDGFHCARNPELVLPIAERTGGSRD